MATAVTSSQMVMSLLVNTLMGNPKALVSTNGLMEAATLGSLREA